MARLSSSSSGHPQACDASAVKGGGSVVHITAQAAMTDSLQVLLMLASTVVFAEYCLVGDPSNGTVVGTTSTTVAAAIRLSFAAPP